jgi:hypothetical protein
LYAFVQAWNLNIKSQVTCSEIDGQTAATAQESSIFEQTQSNNIRQRNKFADPSTWGVKKKHSKEM